ncbi:hypothetical protein ACEPAG_9466 [Sanghuangporus baumii]
MPSIHGLSDLFPRSLKDLSAQLLPRLRLIPEFRCWLPPAYIVDNCSWDILEPKTSQALTLWNSLSQGTPLLILLDLLGSKTGGNSLVYEGNKGDEDNQSTNAVFIAEFLRRVEILEIQGRLSYGEIFRVEEFLSGSCSGFIKVLKLVQRVLDCLEATYPNLYELPRSAERQKEDLFEKFLDSEMLYLEDMKDMKECTVAIMKLSDTNPMVLEYLAAQIDRIILYQEHIIAHLQSVGVRSTDSIRWSRLFGIRENMYISGAGAYRSYCSQYYSLLDFIDFTCIKNRQNETLYARCFELSQQLAFPTDHILSFIDTCSAVLDVTHPVENFPAFKALCSAYQTLLSLKDDISEVMRSKRASYAKRYISNRTPHAHLNMDCLALGEFILDDCLHIEFRNFYGPNQSRDTSAVLLTPNDSPHPQREAGTYVFAFLFEQILLLGRPIITSDKLQHASGSQNHNSLYCPDSEWNFGPAIHSCTPFDVLCAVSLAEIIHVERSESEDFSVGVTWVGREDGPTNTLLLVFACGKQLEQWIRALSRLAPSNSVLIDITDCDECNGKHLSAANSLSWLDDLEFSRRSMSSKPRPWSLIARKEEALASSLYLFSLSNGSEHSLFSVLSSSKSRIHRFERGLSASPRSLSSARSTKSAGLIADPVKLAGEIQSIEAVLQEGQDVPPDLTGQVRRIGSYPAAHGGYSDVWKCNWISGTQCNKVAVKVLRGKLLDAEREDKIAKRLQHEIKVWKRLNHENVVPLHGTCCNFGRYLSLVCPWYENGSLYQYVRKKDGELKLPERLQLLSDVAAGLAYLHSCSIIHGDLSSANILINDKDRACLCDFGLSTLVEDLVDSWYPSSMLGGAIRWSAPELYCLSFFDHPESPKPMVSVSSDIYSFGSVALEILSGKVPYYYLKHDGQVLIELSKRVKPQRTPSPFLTNDLWDLIGECWNDNPGARPSTARVSSQICLLHQRTLARHSM